MRGWLICRRAVDSRDIQSTGLRRSIDIRASIRREIKEEKAWRTRITEEPGYILTLRPAQISIAVEFRSGLSAAALRDKTSGIFGPRPTRNSKMW